MRFRYIRTFIYSNINIITRLSRTIRITRIFTNICKNRWKKKESLWNFTPTRCQTFRRFGYTRDWQNNKNSWLIRNILVRLLGTRNVQSLTNEVWHGWSEAHEAVMSGLKLRSCWYLRSASCGLLVFVGEVTLCWWLLTRKRRILMIDEHQTWWVLICHVLLQNCRFNFYVTK